MSKHGSPPSTLSGLCRNFSNWKTRGSTSCRGHWEIRVLAAHHVKLVLTRELLLLKVCHGKSPDGEGSMEDIIEVGKGLMVFRNLGQQRKWSYIWICRNTSTQKDKVLHHLTVSTQENCWQLPSFQIWGWSGIRRSSMSYLSNAHNSVAVPFLPSEVNVHLSG